MFKKNILGKYAVRYYQCSHCGFAQTEEPYWLDESYSDAINETDIGLISRNKLFCEIATTFFSLAGYNRDRKFLDYGGGYGMFVRMMRDNGFNYFNFDKFCQNLFASRFDEPDPTLTSEQYELISAFEVFEHLIDPISEIEKLLAHSDSILFSTELFKSGKLEDWWYIMPEHGQHVAFYSRKTLEFIANKYQLHLYTNNRTLHLLTKKRINPFFYRISCSYPLARIYNSIFSPKSLLESDYAMYVNSEKEKV